ncbi:MAG: sigma 54-interacting transcriptional regulator [Bacillota bacterium]
MPDLKVKDIMSRSFIRADEGLLLQTVQRQAGDGDWEAVIVQNKSGKVRGIISRERILQWQGEQGEPAGRQPPLTRPAAVDEEDEITTVISLLLKGGGGVLVKDGAGSVTGVVTPEILIAKLFRGWQRSQALLDSMLKYASEAICIINEREEVEYWNPRAEVLYGIRRKDIVGRAITGFFSNIMVSRSLKDGKVFRDLYHQPREGSHVLITAAPVPAGGQVIGSISLERDIADIVYLNEELSKTSFKVGQLKKEINRLSKKDPFARIYGHSTAIKETIKIAKKYAATETTLLITGESGSGKELFAQAIHEESNRSRHPFVAVNCGAVPQTLFESEVFGYEGGAFTGAFREGKPGKFELANGGTLFLDEIGELELNAQVKLLRVLQEKVLYRVGGSRPIKVDVRIIAATNRDLERMVKEGRFREDLYYRLNVITLTLPPLRERREDLPELAYLLTKELSSIHGKSISEFEPQVMVAFMNYHWPGNVRELRNVLERMVILADDEVIRHENLPEFLLAKTPPDLLAATPKGGVKLTEVTEETERQMIVEALKKSSYKKAEAARMLGIPRSSLYYKMKVLGITLDN